MVLASVSYGQELTYLYCERSGGLMSLDVGKIRVLSISEEKHDSILLWDDASIEINAAIFGVS